MVMQALGRPLEMVNRFARVNNVAVTRDGLIGAGDGMMLDPRARASDADVGEERQSEKA